MPSKIGPHCLRATDGARKLLTAGCRIIKLVDDFGLGPELDNKPGLTVIGRSYAHNPRTAEEQQKAGESPANAARRFIDHQKEKYRLNPTIKIWEGHNEAVWGNQEEMIWYANFEVARLKILADMGLRGVIACFATGAPGDIELWKWFTPAVQAAKQYDGILGLHEYSSPWMWWMTGKYQMNPNEDAGDEGWTTLRYRKIMRNYLKPAGCDDVKIAITECGLDRVGPVPEGASSGNWRTNSDWWGQWNGQTDPIDYWRNGGREAEKYYAEQFIWYDKEMRKDPNVLGAVVYTFGFVDATWKDYNVDGTKFVDYIAEYIQRESNVPDAASAPQPAKPAAPVTVTTPTTPPPVQVITPPASGTATGVNLLANADFDDGQHYHWHNIPEIVIPNKWDFWHATHTTPYLPRQDQNFDPPECVVWNIAGAPAEEKSLFWLSGTYCLKIFKGWGAIWWRLFQTVSGLAPGKRYRFTAPIYPDLYMKYVPEQGGKVFADDPLAGEVRVSAKSGGKETETGWLDGTKFPFGKYTFFTLDFLASDTSAELSIEGRGRWGLLNNGWFLDSMKLVEIAGAPVTAQPVQPAQPAQPSQPTQPSSPPVVSPLPTAPALKNPSFAGGTYLPTPALRNLEAPNAWQLWYADEKTAKVSKQTEAFKAPRAGVITLGSATPDDKDGLSGGLAQAYRVVGNWRAIWFSLSQSVNGLTPGGRYRFNVKMMPDPVDKYIGANNDKVFANDPDAGEIWLRAQSGGQKSQSLKRLNVDYQPGGYSTFSHEFTAVNAEATVTLEVRARFALTQNAWYIATASIVPASGGAGPPSPVTATAPAPAPVTITPLKPGRRGIAGELRLFVSDKLKYASQIENIKFHELIVNTTDKPLTYGVLGVEIINKDTGEKTFHTSFSGDLVIGAKCKGPKDTCGGEVIDQLRIQNAGNYRLALAICHATVNDCLGGRGDWETLTTGIDIVVDNWRPPG